MDERLFSKLQKVMDLAGDNPQTDEQKTAYKMAQKILKRMGKEKAEQVSAQSHFLLDGAVVKPSLKDRILSGMQRVKTVRVLDWFDYIDPKYIRFKIVPDSSARNWRSEDLVKTIADQFKLPIERIIWDGFRIRGYRVQERTSFEIAYENGKVNFYICTPEHIAPLIKRRVQSIWDKATVEPVEDLSPLDPDKTAMYELLYRKHDMYSLHTDAKDNLPLSSLMESGRMVGKDERARVFVYLDPIHQLTWSHDMKIAWEKLRKGTAPRRMDGSLRNIFMVAGIAVSKLLYEVVTSVSEMMGGEESMYKNKDIDPEASQHVISNLSATTKQKAQKGGINVALWTAAEADDKTRADLIARSLAYSYSDLSLDNDLEARSVRGKRKKAYLETIENKKPPKVTIRYNKMSTAEASKLTQITGRELLEMYPEIEHIEAVEIEVKESITKGGLYLGGTRYKGEVKKVYMPIDNWDELCLPTVVIGGMGMGKTLGFGANRVVEAVKNGFGAIAIDPAKREIGNEVEKVLSKEQVYRIDLSKVIISLDWCEAMYDERSKSRLVGTIMSFFNADDDTGGQTERFIKAAVYGMRTGRISEIMKIFTDMKYLAEIIKEMPDGLNKETLLQFKAEGDARKRQILSPIYNRLNPILSDPHLAECMDSDNVLDMVKIMSERKAVIIDVPDDSIDTEAKDILINLICSKIDLAMRIREKVTGEEFPFFVVLDEPHQYLRSASIWKGACVESRKFKVGYVWLFHYWEQLPNFVQKAIKSALPQYHIYLTSKDTYRSLSEEIHPVTLEEALKTKRFYAINVLRTGGETTKPFIAKMAAPPSKQRNKKK